MAYSIHNVSAGDIIRAKTTKEQDNQIYYNEQQIEILKTKTGSLENLNTTEKTNLVGAINELSSRADTQDSQIAAAQALANETDKLSNLSELSMDIDIPFNVVDFGYINRENGSVITNGVTLYKYTDYINVNGINAISYKRVGLTFNSTSLGMAWYDANKAYIGGTPAATRQASEGYVATMLTAGIPSNAVYARFTTFADVTTYGSFAVAGSNTLSLNFGNEYTTTGSATANTLLSLTVNTDIRPGQNVVIALFGTGITSASYTVGSNTVVFPYANPVSASKYEFTANVNLTSITVQLRCNTSCTVTATVGSGLKAQGVITKVNNELIADSVAHTDSEVSELCEEIAELESGVSSAAEIKDSDAEVDFDISDPDGNVIVRFEDGEIKTKNFDSTDVGTVVESVSSLESAVSASPILKNSSATGINLDVSDSVGNVLVRFKNGHVSTKNFDSSAVVQDIADLENAVFPESATSVTVNSVSDLLDAITNGTTDIIYLANGTYSAINVEVTRNVQIIGESRTGVIINSDGTTTPDVAVTDRHGIRFQKGGALKNLTFNVNDVKYVMHQDNISTSYDLLVENCTFNRYDDSCGYYFFIGCGVNGKQNITVKNCAFIFSNNTNSRDSSGIYWHNWHLAHNPDNAYAANLTIQNCSCIGCKIVYAQDLASKDVNDVISVFDTYSTETIGITSGSNGYYLDVANADVPYNILYLVNCKVGDMRLIDRTSANYTYLGAVVDNFV